MPEENKVVRRVEIMLETFHPEVAVYLGAYIDGIHDTCTWIGKIPGYEVYNKVGGNRYKWTVDLKERLNISKCSEEEIKEELSRTIRVGLEFILRDERLRHTLGSHNLHKFDFNLQVKEVKE